MTTNCDLCGHTTVADMVVVAWIDTKDIIWMCQPCGIIAGWAPDAPTTDLATFAQKAEQLQLPASKLMDHCVNRVDQLD